MCFGHFDASLRGSLWPKNITLLKLRGLTKRQTDSVVREPSTLHFE